MKQWITAIALTACAWGVQAKDLVDTAVGAGQFKTLTAALQAAGLTDTLKSAGPFTVFAPTDAAFAKIPKAELDALMADKEKLAAVLKYHVVPGKLMSKDARAGEMVTAQGQAVTLSMAANGLQVNDSRVVQADVDADNGVIHVVDTVILPK